MNLPAIRLVISLEPVGSTATLRAHIREAIEIGFDIVRVVDDRCDDRSNVAIDHAADASSRTGGVNIGDDVYQRLDEVSRIDLGEPHASLHAEGDKALGGDRKTMRLHPVPTV